MNFFLRVDVDCQRDEYNDIYSCMRWHNVSNLNDKMMSVAHFVIAMTLWPVPYIEIRVY